MKKALKGEQKARKELDELISLQEEAFCKKANDESSEAIVYFLASHKSEAIVYFLASHKNVYIGKANMSRKSKKGEVYEVPGPTWRLWNINQANAKDQKQARNGVTDVPEGVGSEK